MSETLTSLPTSIQQEIWAHRTDLREPLARTYGLFVHETEYSRLRSIADCGLAARDAGSSADDALIRLLGHSETKMVCLHPVGSFPASSTKNGPFSLLGLAASFLPECVTLDWSFSGNWSLAKILKMDSPDLTATQIFLEVVRRRGSVAALNDIDPRYLHVLCQSGAGLSWKPLKPIPDDVLVYPTAGSQLRGVAGLPMLALSSD